MLQNNSSNIISVDFSVSIAYECRCCGAKVIKKREAKSKEIIICRDCAKQLG